MTTQTLGNLRQDNMIQKLLVSKLFWLFFLTFLFSYPIYRSMNRVLPPELPIISHVPQFEFTNEFGKNFGSNDLKGKAYLASFLFTSCPTSCPVMMGKLQKVQKRIKGLGDRVAMVSFSVDPTTDTPKRLFQYGRDYKANPRIWSFVTGPEESLTNFIVDGFKVAVSEKKFSKEIDAFDIAHSERVVLVDRVGRIRGYYSLDKNSVNQLMIDLGLLINRPVTKEI